MISEIENWFKVRPYYLHATNRSLISPKIIFDQNNHIEIYRYLNFLSVRFNYVILIDNEYENQVENYFILKIKKIKNEDGRKT